MTRAGASLAPEWRRWVVENLLRGAELEDLVSILVRAGVESDVAAGAVRAELEDPCFQGAARAVAMHRKLEGLLDLYGDLYRQAPGHDRVDLHDVLSPGDFFERYYFQNRPVVTRATVRPLDVPTWERLVADVEGGAAAGREAPVAPAPWRQLVVLPEGLVDTRVAPRLWWEPVETRGALAPARRNVLLCQVHGRRAVRLVPAFALHRVQGASAAPQDVPVLEVELGPGSLVLLPVGWWCSWHAPEGGAALAFEAFLAPEPNVDWAPGRKPREPTPPPRVRLD